MTIGHLDNRVTFLRRPKQAADDGNERGDYIEVMTVWAQYTPMKSDTRATYGYVEDQVSAWLKVREQAALSDLTNSDRVRIGGQLPGGDTSNVFAVDSVPILDRSGYRLLRVSRKMG